MKINILSLFLLFALMACSQEKDFKSIDAYLTKTKSTETAKRDLAQMEGGECFSAKLTEDKLLKEIRELESPSAKGSKLIINGLDLSKFPPSQAHFIEKHKEWIQTLDLQLTDCTDVKCLFERIYSNSNGLEGYIYYYFFLKMGYALNTVKSLPDVALREDQSFRDVLFSHEELQYFYYLSKLVSPSFQKMSTLSSFYRLPKYSYIPKYGDKTCGLAGGYLDKGWIILMDGCLSTDPTSILKGNFIPLTSHEIAHRMDYVFNKSRFSETKDWMDLSGWYIKENVDATTGKVTERVWSRKEVSESGKPFDGFIREYAATQPGEDFADSVGYFRVKPDELQRLSPRKYEWISRNVYQGKSFTAEGISESYHKFLSSYSMSRIPEIVQKCVSNTASFGASRDSSVLETFKEYDPALIGCIFGGIDQSISSGIQTLKGQEYEACGFFRAGDVAMRNRVMQGLVEFVKSDLNRNIEISTQLLQLAELMNKVQDAVDPRELFIACQDQENSQQCFEEQLKGKFREVASTYTDRIPHQVSTFEDTYLRDNSYSFVRNKIVEIFSQIFVGSDAAFKKEAEKRWASCKMSSVQTEGEVLIRPFSGEAQYISAPILNCLNRNAEETLVKILESNSKKLGISIASESMKKFVLQMYLPHFTSTLQDLVAKQSQLEKGQVTAIKNQIQAKVTNDLIQNQNWIRAGITSEIEAMEPCRTEARSRISQELDYNHREALASFSFHSKSDFMMDHSICTTVVSSQRLKTVYQNNKEEAFRDSLSDLSEKVIEVSRSHGEGCKRQFPRRDSTNAKNRKSCLTKSSKWKSITDEALDDWARNFNYGYSEKRQGQRHVDNKKSELQDRAIRVMESL